MPDAERYQHYELLRREDGSLWELGRGAMGITYKAFDSNLQCPVALKVINSTYLGNETARQRFLREARAAAALRHPNVASVFNLSTDEDNYFYVMEFIDGETVEALVKRKGLLGPSEALNITLQVARALAAAAKQKLVHRDLKPSNLMLVDHEGEPVVKVIDFGLAKTTKDSTEDTAALTIGGFVGTPHFASPEQVAEADLDVRSDIYSLGATLYFMLTGKAPFTGSVGQVMSQHLYKPVPTEALANVPECVVALIRNMMEKDRAKRPQTPRLLQDAILQCLTEIRAAPARSIPGPEVAPAEPLRAETFFPLNYRLIEPLGETPQGQYYLAEDLRRKRLVRQLALRPELVADPQCFKTLETAVGRLRNAPHPLLRAVYSLEIAGEDGIVVEEHVVGPILRDLLRARSVFSAPEVARLITLLASLADHATANRLEYIDFTLLGIHFISPSSAGVQPDQLRCSLIAREHLELKVDGIDFSFSSAQAGTMIGFQTQVQNTASNQSRGNYVKALSLLSYELLGGARTQLETMGQYKPIAALTQDGNTVLRRGLAGEYQSAGELARLLVVAIGGKNTVSESTGSKSAGSKSAGSDASELTQEVQDFKAIEEPASPASTSKARDANDPALPVAPGLRTKRVSVPARWRLVLTLALIAVLGIGGYFICSQLLQWHQPHGIETLSIQTDPPGASVLLDGKPPEVPPNTFKHVPFGAHRLTATLDKFEPFGQDIQVRNDTAPELHIKMSEKQELALLSVRTDPPGASLLLDGTPPQIGSNSFTHVPFGPHRLTATLKNYELVEQDLHVSRGMNPEIHLKLNRKVNPTETWLAQAKASREGSSQQLDAYVHLAQLSAPNSGAYTKEIERIIEQLRSKTPPISSDEFAAYKPILKEAADLDVVPAILWLAENENGNEALTSFLRAAKLGNSYAMMKVGRLYLRMGAPGDNEEGFNWLNKAYNAPNPNLEAGAYIGDCYLSGIGTQRDLQKADDIIMPLAKQNVVPAMTIAGKILAIKSDSALADAQKNDTTPQIRKQFEGEANDLARQARMWWERAVEKGDWNASAHLGQCYELGWGGVQKDEEEAAKRYKEGADHGNAISMFCYGLLINKKPARRSEAENWISRAASAGLPSAIKWCKENNVSFTEAGRASE